MVKTKQTAHKYGPKPNPFLSDNNKPEPSSDMSQGHLISNSPPPASPDEAQPALPLAQGEVMQYEPTESMKNPDIPEMSADDQEVKELSNTDEIQEVEEAEEDMAAIEADEDSPSKPMKKQKKKKKDKKAHKAKTPGAKQPQHTVPTTVPAAPVKSPSNTEDYLVFNFYWVVQREAQLTATAAITSQEESEHPSDSLPEDWQGLEHFMRQIDAEGGDSDTVQQIRQRYQEQTTQIQSETTSNPRQPHPMVAQKVPKSLFSSPPAMVSTGQGGDAPRLPT